MTVSSGQATKRKESGFTLLELMIVVLIIGVLCAIALAAYQNSVIKSRRAAAASCLQERAQFMERFYATKLSYTAAPDPAQCGGGLDTFYTIGFSGTPTGNAFTLTATPKGQQASKDTKCAVLSINQNGVRSASGGGSEADCW